MASVSKLLRILFLAAGIAAGSTTAGYAETSEIRWYTYEAGIEKIKSEGKMGFLHFYTDWCTYCTLMAKQTFADEQVADYLNKHFVPIRVNADKEKTVAKQYGVYRFPSNWFLSGEAETIANRPGFIPPDLMITMLKYLHTDSYKTMNLQEFMDSRK